MKFLWDAKTGERVSIAETDATPEGFLDHHPADPAFEAVADEHSSPAAKPMTKAELGDALTAGGIEFDPKAKRDDLDDLLHEKLRAVLTKRGAEIAENVTTRELWEAVQK